MRPNVSAATSNRWTGLPAHIPGRNLPSTSVLDDDGSFLSGAELDAVLSVAGISDATGAGVYCGSGITAAVVVAALSPPRAGTPRCSPVPGRSGVRIRRARSPSDRTRRTDAHAPALPCVQLMTLVVGIVGPIF